MKINIAIAVLALSCVALGWPQDKPVENAPAKPVSFDPSEVESLRLQLRYKDVQIAEQALVGEAESIKLKHSWPDEVRFDMQHLKFFIPPHVVLPTTKEKK